MYPVLFEIPGVGFPLRSFGVLVATGFLVGLWLWGRSLRRFGIAQRLLPRTDKNSKREEADCRALPKTS